MMPRSRDLAIDDDDDRQQTRHANRLLYTLLCMRAQGNDYYVH